jgi:spermidine synthase
LRSSREARPSGRAIWIAILYALAGCAALVLETTWLRWFRLLFGATAPAVSATLVAFLAGQALGAAAAARFVPRLRRPLAAWALLEGGVAAAALAVPGLIRLGETVSAQSYAALQDAPGALAAARFAIALLATLPASLLMGAALPTVAAAWLGSRDEIATRGTLLYAANLLGAAAGAALAAFLLPPRLGIQGTHHAGVAALCGVGLTAWVLSRGRERELPPPVPERSDADVARGLAGRGRAWLAALSGFGVFAFQGGLALVLDQSVYAFGAVLVVVLVSLALGSAGVSLLLSRTGVRAESLLALALGLAGIGIAAFPALLRDLTAGFDPNLVAGGAILPALRLTLLSAGVPLLAAGAVLPLLFAAAGRGPQGAAPETALGGLLAVNTLGAIAGALAAPYLLLAWLPLWPACFVVALVYAAACAFVPIEARRTRLRRDLGLAFAWIAVLVRASPLDVSPVRVGPDEQIDWLVSGPAGVVTVVTKGRHRSLRTDNHYDLGGSADRVHQERQGHLSGLLRPGAHSVLWIGSATGISSGALLAQPIRSLTLVEIVPGVAEAASHFFAALNRGVHMDPRVRVVLDDARNYVRATQKRFDLVVADLFVPWRAGTGSLYAREHFEAVRARLTESGAFVQWLPLYQLSPEAFASVAATFADVFPRSAIFRGDFFGRFPIVALVGYAGSPPAAEAIARGAVRLAESGETDRWVGDPVGVFSLYVGPLVALDRYLDTAPRNRDDRPLVEFRAPSDRARRAKGEALLLVGERWVRTAVEATAAIGPGDPVFPLIPDAARRAAHAGARLQAAGAAWVGGRAEVASTNLTAAAADLPPALLDPSEPDPSAMEVWPERRP